MTTKTVSHTPGPWIVDGAVDNGWRYSQIDSVTAQRYVGSSALPVTICDTISRDRSIDAEQDTANARLIAAAPAMLEALKYVRESLRNDHGVNICTCNTIGADSECPIEKIVAAIRQAEEGK